MGLYLAGVEGRLLRSLKSLLGSSLLEEETAVGGRLLCFRALIARYLAERQPNDIQNLLLVAGLLEQRPVRYALVVLVMCACA